MLGTELLLLLQEYEELQPLCNHCNTNDQTYVLSTSVTNWGMKKEK